MGKKSLKPEKVHRSYGSVKLADPDNLALGKHIKQGTGSVSITADKDGRYEYCFSNQMSTIADKVVRYVHIYHYIQYCLKTQTRSSFNVHGIIYVEENGDYFC